MLVNGGSAKNFRDEWPSLLGLLGTCMDNSHKADGLCPIDPKHVSQAVYDVFGPAGCIIVHDSPQTWEPVGKVR